MHFMQNSLCLLKLSWKAIGFVLKQMRKLPSQLAVGAITLQCSTTFPQRVSYHDINVRLEPETYLVQKDYSFKDSG